MHGAPSLVEGVQPPWFMLSAWFMIVRHSSKIAPGCSVSVLVTHSLFSNCAPSLELKTGWHMAKSGLRITTTRVESSGLPSDLWAGNILLSPFQKLEEPWNYRTYLWTELNWNEGNRISDQGQMSDLLLPRAVVGCYSMVLRTPKHPLFLPRCLFLPSHAHDFGKPTCWYVERILVDHSP